MYPILLEFGPFTLHSIWFFIAMGFMEGALALSRILKRYRIKVDFLSRHGFWLLLSALIFSRLFFVIFHAAIFFGSPSSLIQKIFMVLRVWDKGLSFWGALLGFCVALIYFAKSENENIKKWADMFTLPTLIALASGHIGAFLDGINHGRETIMPWGVTFQSAVVKYTVPVHPTQIYALIYTLIILFFLRKASNLWFVRYEGLTAKAGIVLYATCRFFEDFFRGDDTLMLFDIIRVSQIITIGTVIYFGYKLHIENPPPITALKLFIKNKFGKKESTPIQPSES